MKYEPVKKSKYKACISMAVILLLYIIENFLLSMIKIPNSYVMPFLWIFSGFAFWRLPSPRFESKLRHSDLFNWCALNFAVIYIALNIIAGLIDGLGKSPYDHSLYGIVLNIFTVGSALVGKEIVRSFMIKNLSRNGRLVSFITVALLMSTVTISHNRYTSLKGWSGMVEFMAEYLLPELCHNFLATYLSYMGGPIPSIIYMGVLQGFHWLSPVLPDLKWITAALIGTMCPIFCFLSMQSIYTRETKLYKRRSTSEDNPVTWMITSLISVGLIWFSVGVFPIYPSVIATGSMEPMIKPGDVVLIKKVDVNSLKEGDVIQFRHDDILISHRIVEIIKEEDVVSYRTKGDNNLRADGWLVAQHEVRGKIIKVVPKIGWPTLLLKSSRDISLDEIEF